MNINDTVVLLSGGIDSTLLLSFYKKKGYNIEVVFFNYGQKTFKSEYESVKNISNFYNVKLNCFDFNFVFSETNYEVAGRNATLILNTFSIFGNKIKRIGIGIHAGTNYYDSSLKFLNQINQIINEYSNGCIYIDAPFINLNKKQIYQLSIENNIPLDLTYSCEIKNFNPCGVCPSCLDKKRFLNDKYK